MSIHSRGRALVARAREANVKLTFQQALNALHALGAKPSEIARKFNWPLTRADAFAFDPDLDEEYREVSRHARYVQEEQCDNCDQTYFRGLDKKGMTTEGSEQLCPECIETHGSWTCPKCGTEIAGDGEEAGVCDGCWDHMMSKD